MTIILVLAIGGACGVLAHRFTHRSYGPVDDLLWGTLGALFGTTVADLSGLSEYGILFTWLTALAGAGIILFVTGFKVEADLFFQPNSFIQHHKEDIP